MRRNQYSFVKSRRKRRLFINLRFSSLFLKFIDKIVLCYLLKFTKNKNLQVFVKIFGIIIFVSILVTILFRYINFFRDFINSEPTINFYRYTHTSGKLFKDFNLNNDSVVVLIVILDIQDNFDLKLNFDEYKFTNVGLLIKSNLQNYFLNLPLNLIIDKSNNASLENFVLQQWLFSAKVDILSILYKYLMSVADVLGLQIDGLVFLSTDEINKNRCNNFKDLNCLKDGILDAYYNVYGRFGELSKLLFYDKFDKNYKFIGNMNEYTWTKVVSEILDNSKVVDTVNLFEHVENRFYIKTDDSVRVFFNKLIFTKSLTNEQAMVEIYNGSSINGLASTNAHYLRNLGFNVIKIGTYESIYNNTLYIKTQDGIDRFSFSISKLKDYFGETLDIKIGNPKVNTIGDLIVILGSNEIK